MFHFFPFSYNHYIIYYAENGKLCIFFFESTLFCALRFVVVSVFTQIQIARSVPFLLHTSKMSFQTDTFKLLKELRKAAKYGQVEKIRSLLADIDPVVDINAAGGLGGGGPLHYAAQHNQLECVELLLSDERIDINAKHGIGGTALHLASSGGYVEVVEILLQTGLADVHIKDGEDRTALDVALEGDWSGITYDHLKISRLLVQRNAKRGSCVSSPRYSRVDMLINFWMDAAAAGEKSRERLVLPPEDIWKSAEADPAPLQAFLDNERVRFFVELAEEDVYAELRARAAWDDNATGGTVKGQRLVDLLKELGLGDRARDLLPPAVLEDGVSSLRIS